MSLLQKGFSRFYNYTEFLNFVVDLVDKNETSGLEQTDEHKSYTQLNLKRMERWNKTIVLDEELKTLLTQLKYKQTWVLITETWCGDSAQILPTIAKISEYASSKIDLKIILRDENPEWMNSYLTNGSRSIPKLISFNENGDELFQWGPRPQTAVSIFKKWKSNPNTISKEDFHLELHTWYAKDKGKELQMEILSLLLQ